MTENIFCFPPRRLGVFPCFRQSDGASLDPQKAARFLDNVRYPANGQAKLENLTLGQLRTAAASCSNIIENIPAERVFIPPQQDWDRIERIAKGTLEQIAAIAESAAPEFL